MTVLFDLINNHQSIVGFVENFNDSKLFLTYLFSFITALISSFVLYPTIIYLSYKKKFYAVPNSRSSHKKKTPTVGGVPLFIGFIISFNLSAIVLNTHIDLFKTLALITATFVIFIMGLKDDLAGTRAIYKLFMQIIISFFLIYTTNTQITGFDGVLGMYNLGFFSFPITIFLYILIINSINLIDGIDGLAGSLTLFIALFFGVYFSINGFVNLALLSFCLSGALISFLFFNFSNKRKIFMGDCGSLFIGLIIAFLTSSLLDLNKGPEVFLPIKNAPVVLLSLLLYPFLDTLRVFIIRVKNKKSPLSPDKNHLHHVLLSMGYSHIKSTIIIISFTLMVTLISLFLVNLDPNIHIAIIILIVLICLKFLLNLKSKKVKTKA